MSISRQRTRHTTTPRAKPLWAQLDNFMQQPKVPYTSRYQYELASQSVTSVTSVVNDEELRRAFTAKEIDNLIEFNPVYKAETLWRYHDVYRNDGAVARAIDTIIFYCLGQYVKLTLDSNEYHQTEDDQMAAADAIKDNLEYQLLVKLLHQVNKDTSFNAHLVDALRQSFMYGKAAILKERNKADIPYCLKTLNSIRIGKVWAWRDTWELAAIEYLDFEQGERILKAEDIIYVVNRNGHATPNTYWHGYSLIEAVADIAETNMLNRQTNVRNINEMLWAAFMVIKMRTKSQKAIDDFKHQYKAGQPFVSNQDFMVEVHKLAHDLAEIMDEQREYDRKIGRDMNVPLLLMGFEDIETRATGSITFYGFINSVITYLRTWLKTVIEQQWIDPNLKSVIILRDGLESIPDISQYTRRYNIADKDYDPKTVNPALEVSAEVKAIHGKPIDLTEELEQQQQQEAETGAAELSMDSTQKYPPNAAKPDIMQQNLVTLDDLEVSMLPFKITADFVAIEVDTPLDQAARIIGLKKADIYDLEKSLEELGAKDILARRLAEKERNKMMFQTMTNQEQQPGQQQEGGDNKEDNNKTGDSERVKGLPDAEAKADELTNISKRQSKPSQGGGNAALRLQV